MRNSKTISRLLYKYLQGTLTSEDGAKLERWKNQSSENLEFFESLSKEARPARSMARSRAASLEERIFNKIRATQELPGLERNVKRIRPVWWKYAAAAAVAGIVISYGIHRTNNGSPKPSYVQIEKPQVLDVHPPDANYASITLADGQIVNLNGAASGWLATQGKVQVIKTAEGVIVYKSATAKVKDVPQLNTLSNPQGSNAIGIVLQDGSKVWLNAGSSLTYPAAFTGRERKVFILGEAYFEVAKNKAMPFRIMKESMMVEVLGTRFNVNAYRNEPSMKVTLLEGSIRISSGNVSGVLKPGQQAKVNENNINVSSDINVDHVMSWKSGYFSFENASLKEVMRQIARWYNIQVIYDGELSDERFGGELRMDSKLSSVLKVLQKSGVKFRIETNRVVVSKQ